MSYNDETHCDEANIYQSLAVFLTLMIRVPYVIQNRYRKVMQRPVKIILSSIMLAVVLSCAGFIERLINYLDQINAVPEVPGQTIKFPFDYAIVVFAILITVFMAFFIIFFKKSYKIPTKAERKNI